MSTEENQGLYFMLLFLPPNGSDWPVRHLLLTVVKTVQCDGSNPCHRCNQADQVCTFTERKRPKGRIYPDGYVLPASVKIYQISH